MKVLLINNRHFYGGGTETVYFNTANLLREAGHEVVFFSFRDVRNVPCEHDMYFADKGNKLEQLCHYFYNKNASRKLEELIVAEKPDIAHIHLLWGGMSPSILEVLRRNKIPIVHTVHEYRMVCPAYLFRDGKGRQCERCKGGRFYQCLLHRCSKRSFLESFFMTLEMYYRNYKYHPTGLIDGFLFVSNFTRRKHVEHDSRFSNVRAQVLYNCPDSIIKDSLDVTLDTHKSYYLYYGRLSLEKGVETLLRAFEHHSQLKLKIVGTGPLEKDLKCFCMEKGLTNIEFLGFKTGKELFDLVARAKYVCVPSECYENNPMSVVESYSLATPVIGARMGGTAEIVNDGETGFTFESGSVDSLISVINRSERISKEDYCKQKSAAYNFGIDNFSREVHLKKLLSFYDTVLKNCMND